MCIWCVYYVYNMCIICVYLHCNIRMGTLFMSCVIVMCLMNISDKHFWWSVYCNNIFALFFRDINYKWDFKTSIWLFIDSITYCLYFNLTHVVLESFITQSRLHPFASSTNCLLHIPHTHAARIICVNVTYSNHYLLRITLPDLCIRIPTWHTHASHQVHHY